MNFYLTCNRWNYSIPEPVSQSTTRLPPPAGGSSSYPPPSSLENGGGGGGGSGGKSNEDGGGVVAISVATTVSLVAILVFIATLVLCWRKHHQHDKESYAVNGGVIQVYTVPTNERRGSTGSGAYDELQGAHDVYDEIPHYQRPQRAGADNAPNHYQRLSSERSETGQNASDENEGRASMANGHAHSHAESSPAANGSYTTLLTPTLSDSDPLQNPYLVVLPDQPETVPNGPSQVPNGPSQAVSNEPSQAIANGLSQAVPNGPSQAVPNEPSQAVPNGPSQAVPNGPSQAVPVSKQDTETQALQSQCKAGNGAALHVSDISVPVHVSTGVSDISVPVHASTGVSDVSVPVNVSTGVSDVSVPVNVSTGVSDVSVPVHVSTGVSDEQIWV